MKPRVLYIGGTGRSGSTLLAGVLASYEGLVPVGELRYLWDRGLHQNQLCACRQPFRSCPFWTEVVADAFGSFAAADRLDVAGWSAALDRLRFVPALASPRLRTARFRSILAEYGDALSLLYRSITSISGARAVVDSSKDPSYAFVLHALRSFDLSIVHLIRDSRAVAHSFTRARVRPEIHWRVEYMKCRSPLRTALFWDGNHALFELLGRGEPGYLRLRYEDFVSAPGPRAAEVASLVDGGPPVLRTGGGWAHSISGNPVRFEQRPVKIRLDDEWRTRLDAKERLVVTVVTAPLLRRYGYLGGDVSG